VTPGPADPDRPDARLASLGYVAQLQGFADAVAGRGGAVCPLGFGRRVAQITAAAYASAEASGAPQPVPAP
jgi:predicted dehydrogenase